MNILSHEWSTGHEMFYAGSIGDRASRERSSSEILVFDLQII
jgi:hypothetical protein